MPLLGCSKSNSFEAVCIIERVPQEIRTHDIAPTEDIIITTVDEFIMEPVWSNLEYDEKLAKSLDYMGNDVGKLVNLIRAKTSIQWIQHSNGMFKLSFEHGTKNGALDGLNFLLERVMEQHKDKIKFRVIDAPYIN